LPKYMYYETLQKQSNIIEWYRLCYTCTSEIFQTYEQQIGKNRWSS
jgi:hypothetical protein